MSSAISLLSKSMSLATPLLPLSSASSVLSVSTSQRAPLLAFSSASSALSSSSATPSVSATCSSATCRRKPSRSASEPPLLCSSSTLLLSAATSSATALVFIDSRSVFTMPRLSSRSPCFCFTASMVRLKTSRSSEAPPPALEALMSSKSVCKSCRSTTVPFTIRKVLSDCSATRARPSRNKPVATSKSCSNLACCWLAASATHVLICDLRSSISIRTFSSAAFSEAAAAVPRSSSTSERSTDTLSLQARVAAFEASRSSSARARRSSKPSLSLLLASSSFSSISQSRPCTSPAFASAATALLEASEACAAAPSADATADCERSSKSSRNALSSAVVAP
mmetsp:Transcript_15355/g.49324  ORF Transcript_15355/g.49324 Transcript_15355/m.49324 type:complete len:339 (-) Transcript_15355:1945-2961(-)